MSINRVVIVGRLTDDPVVKKTKTGTSVCSFTLAVDGKRDREKTYFIECVTWSQGADYIGRYGHKGEMWSMDGELQTRTYKDRDGRSKKVTEAVGEVTKVDKSSKRESFSEDTKSAGMDEFMQAYREVKDEEEIPW